MLIYEIQGKPVPWQASQKSGNRFFNPKHVQKEQAVWQLKAQQNHPTLSGPLRVDFFFYLQPPKSVSKIRYRQMLNGVIYPIGKPDRSNMLKFAEDCLQMAEIISNDSIIISGETQKLYGQFAKTIIKISQLNVLPEAHNAN